MWRDLASEGVPPEIIRPRLFAGGAIILERRSGGHAGVAVRERP